MWEEEAEYYEKLFEKDSRDKKRIARGASARASRKKGFKGAMRTPSDFMTKKEIKALNGEVKVSNVYDKYRDVNNLPDKKILNKMSKDPSRIEECRIMLTVAKEYNSTTAIRKATGLSGCTLYTIYDRVGVEYNKGIHRGSATSEDTPKVIAPEIVEEKPKNSFTIQMKGVYSKQDIENRILSLSSLMLENSTYEFEMIIKEV